ncbi:hypothetical protein GQ651_04365 [Alphaproteobacteria bacterium GH1-50]|uniref:Uncharacterized protein n=1 Tax=Kangsaoukella pontilimi TaxID=2691042 RepID=A0A7C9M973_9RHOB|nr:hypothetical protein [Kangsaoukella pontilimi]MXQ07073.1 hypothetical protein [Kangsaoukella pontilimi]
MSRITPVLTVFCLMTLPGMAAACPEGARCLAAPESTAPVIAPGDVLSPGTFNMLINAEYFGLPRTSDGSWYVTVERRVLRIEPRTYQVIEDVTEKTNRVFW